MSSHLDETIDAASLASLDPSSPHVALVEGCTPHLSGETQCLLRSRLRITAILLFVGFAAFLVRSLLFDEFKTSAHWMLLWDHIAVTAMTGLIAVGLCRQCVFSLRKLRVIEALLFVCPAVFFLMLNYVELATSVAAGVLWPITPPWMLLMFTYAIFIPNTWRRAGVVLCLMALVPLLLLGYLTITSAALRDVLAGDLFRDFPLVAAMVLAMSAIIGTVGVKTIGALRKQALRAKQLGQYRLKHMIGSGGMGEVYLAEHELMKRPCAIKIIHPDRAGDPHALARFEREVRATAKLSHWNTVEIFDYGRAEDGTFYYVMEYLPGMSLAQLVESTGPLPAERAIHLLTQTCDALSEAHENGLIHRDLKPGNLFAAHRGGVFDVAKLLDFGLAKPLTDARSTLVTQVGTITGSPLFMSPEQAMGEDEIDGRSDIYSLGAVAYYIVTGRPPFDGDKPLKIMAAHSHEPVPAPSDVRPDVPHDLEAVIMRCLAKHPDDRYQTAAELRDALLDCEAAGLWNREIARDWWLKYGCPKKRALDALALQGTAA